MKIIKSLGFLSLLLWNVALGSGEPPVTTQNEVFEEISKYLTVAPLKSALELNGTVEIKNLAGEVLDTFSKEDLLVGEKCFEPTEPWNRGCIPIQRNYHPKYSPFALEYEAKLALQRAQDTGQKFTPEEETKFIENKKTELSKEPDYQADEATGVGILDLSGNPERGIRAGSDADILTIFRRFDKYAEMVPQFFKDCMQLTQSNFDEKGVPTEKEFGTKVYYQTSRIMMGVYPVHQTLIYHVTRHPETGAITAAWKLERRFKDPLGFKAFEYTMKIKQPGSSDPREKIEIPVFDTSKKDFIPQWKQKNMVYFPSEEYFESWKAKLTADTQRFKDWSEGKILIHNNQFGLQNIHEQSGFFLIEPYDAHQYFVTKHLYTRVDPTNPEYDFRGKDEDFENLRTATAAQFIKSEASALRKALEELR